MSIATPTHRFDADTIPHIAAVGRAQRVVATFGGRLSTELGSDPDGGADEVERWALSWGQGAASPVDERVAAAAEHLHLGAGTDDLCRLASSAHLDIRDLEAALLRLSLTHDLARCAGGEECPFVCPGRDRHVHG